MRGLGFGDAEQRAAKHALRHDAVRSVRRNQDADGYAQSGHRQLKLPSMSTPPVKLLSAPLPWPLRTYLAGSLSGRFAPRLTPRTSTPPGADFGRKVSSNTRARPPSSRNRGLRLNIAKVWGRRSPADAFNLPITHFAAHRANVRQPCCSSYRQSAQNSSFLRCDPRAWLSATPTLTTADLSDRRG